uniref:AlNc14C260G9792 protein n=1 Tax=Albugo laibachii Nc14 TaxID=890382 RepID=F0WTW8_9STRA|nr:AlNc14C260G9792 [Albugo laibachii Nc14]CCA26314.1 AlNc14C365G11051 [Albugo laibachii Nc14]|eukprot:CCA26314.1 AlNc14C365G11051 [Albugo laibachii Nc14]
MQPDELDKIIYLDLQLDQIHKTQEILEALSERVLVSSNKAREKNRVGVANKRTTKPVQFDVGDFVLYADVWAETHNKLKTKWNGPAQVVRAISEWVSEIRNVVT